MFVQLARGSPSLRTMPVNESVCVCVCRPGLVYVCICALATRILNNASVCVCVVSNFTRLPALWKLLFFSLFCSKTWICFHGLIFTILWFLSISVYWSLLACQILCDWITKVASVNILNVFTFLFVKYIV